MTDDMTTEQRLELLRQAARISPILRECVEGVVDEVERLTAENAALRRVAEAADAYHAAFDHWPDGGWTTVASLQRAEKHALAAWREVKA